MISTMKYKGKSYICNTHTAKRIAETADGVLFRRRQRDELLFFVPTIKVVDRDFERHTIYYHDSEGYYTYGRGKIFSKEEAQQWLIDNGIDIEIEDMPIPKSSIQVMIDRDIADFARDSAKNSGLSISDWIENALRVLHEQ